MADKTKPRTALYKKIIFILVAAIATIALGSLNPELVQAQDTLLVWPDGAPGAKGNTKADKPTLTVYLPPEQKANGTGVLVVPGGGYAFVSMEHEGSKIAEWLNSQGIAAFVLDYRIGNRYHYPAPFDDATRAMRIVRKNAQKWSVQSNRLGIIGFSAGGHLASTIGTHWSKGDPNATDPYKKLSSRPDFMILAYPVITMTERYMHEGSRNHLLGKDPDHALAWSLSNETQVTPQTPPTFLAHASNDPVVPVENSIHFYEALRKAGVPVEMHLYEDGPHGFGLAKDNPYLATWTTLCENWMRQHGWL